MTHRSPSRLRQVDCHVCGTAFHTRHSQGRYCSKGCRRTADQASWSRYRTDNRESRNAGLRDHYERNRSKVLARTNSYAKTEAGKRAARVTWQGQLVKHPERIFARQVVTAALRAGYLHKESCRKCGDPKAQAHHTDYLKPFDVEWLCRPCHVQEHRKEKRS